VIAAADKIEISSQIFHGICELGQKLSAKKYSRIKNSKKSFKTALNRRIKFFTIILLGLLIQSHKLNPHAVGIWIFESYGIKHCWAYS